MGTGKHQERHFGVAGFRLRPHGVAAAALLATLALAISACGGSSPSGPPTAAEVNHCILAAGGEPWSQAPILPQRMPKSQTKAKVVMIGPRRAHITVYLSRRPVFDRRLVEEFAEIQEYDASIAYGGRLLMLLDPDIGKVDHEVAEECIAG